ncbi:hypothetical protein [Variovorax sp. dw_308]|uniref:hypothetical protein n=1 Tax=Variovorax sp. dw_308 TaxID=2721546 RepID=UPI001C48D31C|nr:hypothetical protein [Variovorax sp. dw_308]
MNARSTLRRYIGRHLFVLGMGIAGAAATGEALAGCGMYTGASGKPPNWGISGAAGRMHEDNTGRPASNATGIVGMWKVTLVSDGTAYPIPIPNGAPIDFGTAQWHSDGTEVLVSGGRAPSTGDVCMGVWEQIGNSTYKLKHVGLSYSSTDSVPPSSPSVFLGPAIIRETVTLSHSRDSYTGTFTIDQYAADEVTLIEHIGGTVTATRFTVD